MKERHVLEEMVGPVGYWKKLRLYQLNVLKINGLKPHHKLIDIGCGPLQGGIALIDYLEKNKYVGIDICPVKLSYGYRQIEKYNLNNKNPELFSSNTFGDYEIGNRKFDFCWASQVLYYFDSDKLSELFKFVSSCMKPKGKFLGDIIGEKHYAYRYPKPGGYILHTLDSLKRIAEEYGLKARSLGHIVNYGYPKRLTLHTNILIEIKNSSDF